MTSPSQQQSTARSRFLGHELRMRRNAARLTLTDLAARMNVCASTLTRVEQGERSLTQANLITYLALCGVVGDEQQELLELARAREDQWWTCPHRGVEPDELPALRFTFDTSDRATCWYPGALPELLQAEELATWRRRTRDGNTADVSDGQLPRIERQQEHLLSRPSIKKTTFYLQESTLRSVPIESSIRSSQMAHLAMLTAEEKVCVRVLPVKWDHCLPAVGRFWIFGFAEDAPVVCVQTELVSVFAEREPDVLPYDVITQRLNALALSENDSAELVATIGEDYPVSQPTYLIRS